MKIFSRLFTGCLCALAAVILCPLCEAAERIVILAPAAADIVEKLGAGAEVVGKCDSIDEFPSARKVGTHINPSIEIIASLKPTVIISTARFTSEQAARTGAERWMYAPESIDAIPGEVLKLGKRLKREKEAAAIEKSIEEKLAAVTLPKSKTTALFEVRSNPLSLAGQNTVASSALVAAGMQNMFGLQRTSSVSPEFVLSSAPDYYIYQEGPMNLNPVPPLKRNGWERLDSCIIKLDEKVFSRPNTDIFDTVIKLNRILNSENPCETEIINE